jgi:hypothetical protein
MGINLCEMTLAMCAYQEGLYLTSGIPALSANALPDDGGVYATEICRVEVILYTLCHILNLCITVGSLWLI